MEARANLLLQTKPKLFQRKRFNNGDRRSRRSRQSSLVIVVGESLVNLVDDVVNGRDFTHLVLVDVNVKIFFERDHQLRKVERIRAKIVRDIAGTGDLLLIARELVGDDLNYLLFNLFLIGSHHKPFRKNNARRTMLNRRSIVKTFNNRRYKSGYEPEPFLQNDVARHIISPPSTVRI